MANTYLVEVSDDAKSGKVVFPLQKPEIQRPAIDFVFDVLGAEVGVVLADHKMPASDTRILQHLQGLIFTRENGELLIRDGISFEANRTTLDPDAHLEEYFLPRRGPGINDVFVCSLEIVSHDPETAKRRQMLAFQIMFALHRFKLGHQTTGDEVDTLTDLTGEAENKGLLIFNMGKNTFAVTPDGEKAHASLVAEAQELIRRYDIFADADMDSDGSVRFGTGLGRDLRVPIWEFIGINPFRTRFVLGLNDGEWDTLADWPRAIVNPEWFDGVFAPIEESPSVEDIGRDTVQRIFEEGKRALRGDDPEQEDGDYETVTTYAEPGFQNGYRDGFFSNNWWWVLFLL